MRAFKASSCKGGQSPAFVYVEPAWNTGAKAPAGSHIGTCYYMTAEQARELSAQLLQAADMADRSNGIAAAATDGPSIDIVFDGPPSHESGRFVEVEREGKSINIGQWIEREDKLWILRIPLDPRPATPGIGECLDCRHTEHKSGECIECKCLTFTGKNT